MSNFDIISKKDRNTLFIILVCVFLLLMALGCKKNTECGSNERNIIYQSYIKNIYDLNFEYQNGIISLAAYQKEMDLLKKNYSERLIQENCYE